MPSDNPFKWRQFEPGLILLCVRWYLRYAVSYRDLEDMMRERGLCVDHTTIYRWVQRYAPEIRRTAPLFLPPWPAPIPAARPAHQGAGSDGSGISTLSSSRARWKDFAGSAVRTCSSQ